MANPSVNFGFQPLGLFDGVSPNFGVFQVSLGASNTHTIAQGDVAGVITAGLYDRATASGGGAAIGGVFWGSFEWYSKSAGRKLFSPIWLGQTTDILVGVVTAHIIYHPHARFKVRTRGTLSRAIALTDGPNINFNVGAGAGANNISTYNADDADMGSGASLPFRILDLVQQPESDPSSTFNEIIVGFNNASLP